MGKIKFHRVGFVFLVTLFISLIPLSNIMAGQKKAEYNWRLQHLLPPELLDNTRAWADTINKMSNGRINIKVYSAGELVPIEEMLKAIGYNTLQMGITTGSIYANISMGDLDTLIIGAWQSPMQTLAARFMYENGKIFQLQNEEYAKHKIKYLGPILADPCTIISKKPLRTIGDFKGLRLHAEGGHIARWAKNLGALPINIAPEEIYTALATGALDAVAWGGADTYLGMGFYEVAKYYHQPYIVNPNTSMIIMNLKVFNSLPEDLKAIVESAAENLRIQEAIYYWHREAFALNEMKAKGLEVVEWSKEVQGFILKASIDDWDEIAKSSKYANEMIRILRDQNKALGLIR